MTPLPRLSELSRRRFLKYAVLGGAGAAVHFRLDYRAYPDWDGAVLANWEAHVLRAAARALLPPAADEGAFEQVPLLADRYLRSFSPNLRRDLHLALATVEHGTTVLTARRSRMSDLDPQSAEHYLATLHARGGLQRQLYRAVRDICMLAYYQQPETWDQLAYDGPLERITTRRPKYARLVAPEGIRPKGWTP